MCFVTQNATKSTAKPSNDGKILPSTQELLVNVLNIDRKTEKFNKEKSTLSHFDFFLQHHCQEPTEKEATKDFCYFQSYRDITFAELEDQDFFSQLATCFFFQSQKYLNSRNALLKFKSAQGYYSLVENYFMDTYKEKNG